MYKKTVIHVFTNNCCNVKFNPNDTSSYWGLGDLIRGSIKLYQYSQIMRFNYYVDINLHPISKYLVNSTHPYTQLVQDNKDNIKYYYIDTLKPFFKKNNKKKSNFTNIIEKNNNDQDLENFECKNQDQDLENPERKNQDQDQDLENFECKNQDQDLENPERKNQDDDGDLENFECTNQDDDDYEEVIMLTTNDRIAETLPITDDCKKFILKIFTPKPEFKLYFNNYVNEILKLTSDYGICHFRFGDDLLIKYETKMSNFESFLNKYINNNYISIKTDILLTDNKLFKKYVLDNNYMISPDTIIKHLGSDEDEDEDEDYGTRDTLVDFFLILNSKIIKSYTVYSWISGFVFWASVLKDIPLIILDK
jgi:hypothetical protein